MPRHAFIDVAGLIGHEHMLVTSVFSAENAAQADIIEQMTTLDVPVPRALEIVLSAQLVCVGVLAEKLGVHPDDFAEIAAAARAQAIEGIAVGSDMAGVA